MEKGVLGLYLDYGKFRVITQRRRLAARSQPKLKEEEKAPHPGNLVSSTTMFKRGSVRHSTQHGSNQSKEKVTVP